MHEGTGTLGAEPPVQVDELASRRKNWALIHIVHIHPKNDQVEHTIFGTGCVCGAEVEERQFGSGQKGYVISHNALDGRD